MNNKKLLNNGTLLERNDFIVRLNNGEIFKKESWNSNNIRYVGYDISIAEDYLILPKKGNEVKNKFKKGEFRKGKITIGVGETIFVSSNEKIQIPWNVYGNIGTKFYLQANGVILYTGLMIEPGLGMSYDETNKVWIGEDDTRLHFFLFNGGERDFVISPKKDKIATVQFFNILEINESDRKKTKGHGNEFIDEMFDNPDNDINGIVFFRNIENQIKSFESSIHNHTKDINRLEILISSLEKGSNQIIMFGVYLVAVTILSISLSSIIASIQKIELVSKNDTINLTISGLLILLFTLVVGFALYFSYRTIIFFKQNKDE